MIDRPVGQSIMSQGEPRRMSADDASLLIESRGPVRVLTLNRPAALNSFNGEMHAQLRAALDTAAADAAVRALVVTGAGRGFCAGQDLNDPELGMVGGVPDVGGVVEKLYKPLALRVRSMPVPVIAAVNGVAAGAGANFALGCDLVIAARSASFIQAFSKIGLVPDCGGTWLLPRLVGRARALGLAMTGDKLPAEEAQRIGLIWQCVDDAALMDGALALAARLAAMPTRALTETRRAIDDAMGLDFAAALSMEAQRQGELGRAHDAREGIAAFVEKRAPRFSDR
jgi:2-(1,2-epoxy-1,2-dihydrophenyl)acetyl-CoA isomerase